MLAVSLAAVLLAAAGLAISWRARGAAAAAGDEPSEGSRRFIPAVSAGLAAIFILAILTQMLAAALLTGCER